MMLSASLSRYLYHTHHLGIQVQYKKSTNSFTCSIFNLQMLDKHQPIFRTPSGPSWKSNLTWALKRLNREQDAVPRRGLGQTSVCESRNLIQEAHLCSNLLKLQVPGLMATLSWAWSFPLHLSNSVPLIHLERRKELSSGFPPSWAALEGPSGTQSQVVRDQQAFASNSVF